MKAPRAASAAGAKAPGITAAVLNVSHPAMMLERFAGLTILERQLFTLSRAGMRRVWIVAHKPEPASLARLRWPDGLDGLWGTVSGSSGAAAAYAPPYIGVSGDYAIRLGALREILSRRHDRPTSYQDAQRRGVVQVVPVRHEDRIEYEKRAMPPDSCALLQTPADKGPALPWLLREAVKDADGFMARHFDRRISLAVTRRLLNSPVRPNHMTVFSSLIGLAGGILMLGGTYGFTLAGALIVWLHSTLDGCDGELARLRFQESRLGGLIDFWGDNLVHFALFASLGIGRFSVTGEPVLLALGLAAALSAAASAALVFQHMLRKAARAREGTPFFDGIADAADETDAQDPASAGSRLKRTLASIEDTLAQRDFIYLLVLLAAIGRIDLFLWAAGVGSPLFLLVFVYLRSRARA
ncbi:MAG: CDP-alcohol phosphatidyltransferase family protein [Elusimicrobiota bacterium]